MKPSMVTHLLEEKINLQPTFPQLEHITINCHYTLSSPSPNFEFPIAFCTLCLFPSGPDLQKLTALYNFIYASNLTEIKGTTQS